MPSEQELDRELSAALSVSPSPDFEARVLQRIDADASSWVTARHGWLAVAAAVVLAAGMSYALPRTPAVSDPLPSRIVDHTVPRVSSRQPEPVVHRDAGEPATLETVRASRPTSQSAPNSAEPEVIVPVNQMAALRRLVRAVNEGRIAAPPEPVHEVLAPAGLTVAPLVVAPIPVPPVEPSGTDRPQRPARDQ